MRRKSRQLGVPVWPPAGYTGRTGARRQQYNARGVALREVGARKRLSSCEIVS